MSNKELREVMEAIDVSADRLNQIRTEDFLDWITEARSAIIDLTTVVRELVDKATLEP